MVEADMSRLLSALSHTAETLNRESDAMNQLIKRFEERLHQLNIGLEVWCADPLASETTDLAPEGDDYEEGAVDLELGWAKGLKDWELYLRERVYRRVSNPYQEWQVVRTNRQYPLRDATRAHRIEALKHFPALLQALKEEAEEAVDAIEEAKRFVALC
jgi:hypothetical protein